MKKNYFDIVIAGAGLVGQPLAVALAENGLRVAILEKHPKPQKKSLSNFDGRAFTIASSSAKMLRNLDMWNDDIANPITSIGIRHQRMDRSFQLKNDILFALSDVSEDIDAFGYVIESALLQDILFKKTSSLDNIKILENTHVKRIDRDSSSILVSLNNGDTLKASLLVGADGATSSIRKLANLDVPKVKYSQNAIVCSIEHEQNHNNHGDELYTSNGPFAVLPMTNNRSNIVISHNHNIANALYKQNDANFKSFLEQRIVNRLGKISLIGKRFSYPLSRLRVRSLIAERVALVGDAAHVMLPVAGQGLNLGLRDVAALAETIVGDYSKKYDFGTTKNLKKFQSWRQTDIFSLVAITDASQKIFDNDSPLLHILRSQAIRAMENCPQAKQVFIRQAMGNVGDLPLLLKGQKLNNLY